MAIRTVITRGYGNGTFNGTIPLVVRRGYAQGAAAAVLAGILGQYAWGSYQEGAMVALTEGAVSGTGTVVLSGHHLPGGMFGGLLLTTDGSNTATIEIRKNNASGERILELSSKEPGFHVGPFRVGDTQVVYYSVTGTGAKAQLYEHIT